MKSFLDTSVLVASFLETHAGHEQALEVLTRASRQNAFCGVHSLAESYSSLTRMPVRPVIPAEMAAMFVEEVGERLNVVTLTTREYLNTVRRAADAGLPGGMIYDLLLLACARKIGADVIYTFNIKHFIRVAPD